MGKNSNVHKNLAYIEDDLRREREADAKRAAKRLLREQKLREQAGEMVTEEADIAAVLEQQQLELEEASAATATAAHSSSKKKMKKFGRVHVGGDRKTMGKAKKIRMQHAKPPPVRGHLDLKSTGIRKPSSIMKKTLKKMAKKKDMDWS